MDLVKIAAVAAGECVRQGATEIDNLRDLLYAYEHAMDLRDSGGHINETVFLTWGYAIEPFKNHGGFRKTPVTFRNGGSSASPQEITRLMINLRDAISY